MAGCSLPCPEQPRVTIGTQRAKLHQPHWKSSSGSKQWGLLGWPEVPDFELWLHLLLDRWVPWTRFFHFGLSASVNWREYHTRLSWCWDHGCNYLVTLGTTHLINGWLGLPWWHSGWESACQCRGHGFEPWSGKIPHAEEQLGPWATITEPARLEPGLRNKRDRDNKRPAHRDEECPPLATTRESPHTETKTQHSHK